MNPAAHSTAARKKAVATSEVSRAFAKRYNASATEYTTGADLVKFMKRHSITLADVPRALHKRIGKRDMAKLKANGHERGGNGIGIPLDAIPAKRIPGDKPSGSGNYARPGKGHPNAQQIDKILDLLAKPDMPEPVAERLLVALDKLIGQ